MSKKRTNNQRGVSWVRVILLFCILILTIMLAMLSGFGKTYDFSAITNNMANNTQSNEDINHDSQEGDMISPDDKTPEETQDNSENTNTATTQLSVKNEWSSSEMAWIYPGEPACNAKNEYIGRDIEFLKPEYFLVGEGGELRFLTEENAGCNGFSEENFAHIKQHSDYQFITVASSYAGDMAAFLEQNAETGEHVRTLSQFAVNHNATGIELDFEDFGGWTPEIYQEYKDFVQSLGDTLHTVGKKLMIDGPATATAEQESWFVWRYKDFVNLPVDYMVIMAYDYQYDQGVGQAVAPFDWIVGSVKWVQKQFPFPKKIVVGIPSYGYTGRQSTNNLSLLTYTQAKSLPGFATATRDNSSGEMTWTNNGSFTAYQDTVSMDQKRKVIEELGINYISIWHLGGNQWFSEKPIN